jgi:predicted NBD/HSP70 family sugar kinase
MQYVGLDVHKNYCQATVVDNQARVILAERINTNRDAIKNFSRIKNIVKRLLNLQEYGNLFMKPSYLVV